MRAAREQAARSTAIYGTSTARRLHPQFRTQYAVRSRGSGGLPTAHRHARGMRALTRARHTRTGARCPRAGAHPSPACAPPVPAAATCGYLRDMAEFLLCFGAGARRCPTAMERRAVGGRGEDGGAASPRRAVPSHSDFTCAHVTGTERPEQLGRQRWREGTGRGWSRARSCAWRARARASVLAPHTSCARTPSPRSTMLSSARACAKKEMARADLLVEVTSRLRQTTCEAESGAGGQPIVARCAAGRCEGSARAAPQAAASIADVGLSALKGLR